MALSRKLEHLKGTAPGCRSVIFGDLVTGTVLRTLAEPGMRQEGHDRTLAEASALLGAEGASILAAVPEQAVDAGPAHRIPAAPLSGEAAVTGPGAPTVLRQGDPARGGDGHEPAPPPGAEEPIASVLRVDGEAVQLMLRGGEHGEDVLVLTLGTAALGAAGPAASGQGADPADGYEAELRRLGSACRAVLASDD